MYGKIEVDKIWSYNICLFSSNVNSDTCVNYGGKATTIYKNHFLYVLVRIYRGSYLPNTIRKIYFTSTKN